MSLLVFLQATEAELGCFVTYWCVQNDVGSAINLALADAEATEGISHPRAASIVNDGRSIPPEHFEPTRFNDLWVSPTRHCWQPNEQDRSIAFPYGVVPVEEAGPFDLDEIVEGYVTGNSDDCHWVEAVIDGRRFLDVLTSCYHWLSKPDGLEIRLMHHWSGSAATEVWVLDQCEGFLGFVIEHAIDILDNGFLEIAFYSRSTDTILRVTEHRTLLCTTGNPARQQSFCLHLNRLGFPPLRTLRSLAAECHHFHYCRAEGKDRGEMVRFLIDSGFRKAAEIPWQE